MASRNYSDLSTDELIRLLEARDRRDSTRFGLVWEANEVERDRALNQDFVVLDLDPALSSGAAPWRNLIIEGDNFDALRYLRMTFAGRVKCIYIDPPYNTGNRDFVYNDRFVEKEDLWRHSKWVEFMHQRLTLARDLLREDGVIFISIDDNEMPSLSLLMKAIFGESNFVATFIWKRRATPDSRNLNGVSGDHEYVLCYQQASGFRVKGQAKDLTKYTNPDNDPLGPWMSDNLTGLANATERPNLHYDLVNPETGLAYPPHPSRGWIYGPDRMSELVKAGRILWPKKSSGRPRLKRYLTDMQSSTTGYSTVLDAPGNVEATKELNSILGGRFFTFPKPVGLIRPLLEQGTDRDDIVMDFFAGSGTTAHAVLEVNAGDKGNRRFILVSNTEATDSEPEKNLCRDICAERVRKAITGYTTEDGKTVPGLGGDFAYLICRRIPPGRLTEMDHAQVWIALQFIHCETLIQYQESPCVKAGDEEQALLYVPSFDRKDLVTIQKAVDASRAVILYSWQPELLRQQVRGDHIQFEHIPESLARRFGLKG